MTSARTSVAIVEPNPDGHRMIYVRRLVREAVRQNLDCRVVTLPQGMEHPVYLAMREELKDRFSTEIMVPDRVTARMMRSYKLPIKQAGYHRLFRHHFQQPSVRRADHVFVPFLDQCDKAISLLGSPFADVPWSGLVMQYKFQYSAMGLLSPSERTDFWKREAFLRLLRVPTLSKLFTIDEPLFQYTHRFYPELAEKLQYVPDPVDIDGDCSRQDARSRFGIPEDQFVILVYGGLSLRKGLAELLKATEQAGFPAIASLLLAGRQDKSVRDLLSGNAAQSLRVQGRLAEADRFLDDSDEFAAFRAADAVWIGYRDFYGMSAVLIQSGAMGLPVIACQEGVIGWLTKHHHLGVIVNVAIAAETQAAVQRLAGDSDFYRVTGQNGQRHALKHQEQHFSKAIVQAISCKP